MKVLMHAVSALFHPLLMLTYFFVVIYLINPALFSPLPQTAIIYFIIAVFTATAVIPAISIASLKVFKIIQSLELINHKERGIPFIAISCFYGFSTYSFLNKLPLPNMISAPMISGTVLIIILGLFSLKFKISIHAAATGGVFGLLLGFFYMMPSSLAIPTLAASSLCCGLVSSSRLFLSYHSLKEVSYGSLLGFIISLTGMILLA